MPMCTCGDTACPMHPSNHDKGFTPCITKNLREGEIPTCFFRLLEERSGVKKPTDAWHFADFAALVALAEERAEKKET